jgi:hypothetical protein
MLLATISVARSMDGRRNRRLSDTPPKNGHTLPCRLTQITYPDTAALLYNDANRSAGRGWELE